MAGRPPRIPLARPLTATLTFVGLALVVLLLALSFTSVKQLERTRADVEHTNLVKAGLGRTLRLLVDAETGQRGFLLTGRPRYFQRFDEARQELTPNLQDLDRLLRDDAGQQARLLEFERLASAKLEELDRTVELEKAGRHGRALAIMATDYGARTMDAIRELDESMRSAENAHLAESSASAERLARLGFWGIATASGLLLCIGLLLYAVGRNLMQREIAGIRSADLGNFAGRVAHDVRSPLAFVGLAVDLARRHTDEPRIQATLDGATRTLRRVATLVDGLLVYAGAGAQPAESAEADVRAVVNDVTEAMRPAAQERRIALELDELCPTAVACSPGVLTSIVANLIDNSIRYMGDATLVRSVSVRARCAGPMTRIEVEDTGPGVPRELRGRLFDPYLRAPDSAAPGLRLGLATVRRLAEAHGGSVGFSANDPTGSLFWFDLPNAPPRTARDAGLLPAWTRLRSRPAQVH
jgi:signal transduction histidine kinase